MPLLFLRDSAPDDGKACEAINIVPPSMVRGIVNVMSDWIAELTLISVPLSAVRPIHVR